MRRLLLLTLLLVPSLAFAQGSRREHGQLSATGSVTMNVVGMASASVQVSGTFNATVAFEISNDNTNWVSMTCEPATFSSGGATATTSAGIWLCPVAGVAQLRARVADYTSGAVVLDLAASSGARALPTPVAVNAAVSGSVDATIANNPTVTVDNLGANVLLGQSTAFSVETAAFTPAATPTDLCVLTGSASTTIKVIDVRLSGTATAAATVDVHLVKRGAADSGGTFVAGTVVPHDSSTASAAPTVGHYTANPTINGTVGTLLHTKALLPIAGTATTTPAANASLLPPGSVIQLRGTTEQLAINFAGAALPAGAASFRCHFSWIEE